MASEEFNIKVILMFLEDIKWEQWVVICGLLLGMNVLIILNYNHIWINVYFSLMHGLDGHILRYFTPICLPKVNRRNTKAMCGICSKLTIKTTGRRE